jgi:hypothetical protein
MRHGMEVQIVTPYRVSHLQSYGVTVRGNVTKCVATFRLRVLGNSDKGLIGISCVCACIIYVRFVVWSVS